MTKEYTRRFTTGGIVVKVEDEESGVSRAGKDWKKRVVVIDSGVKYPNPCKVTFWNDKAVLAASLRKGDEVEYDFYLRGSEYNDRFKVELNGDAFRVVAKSQEPEPEPEEEAAPEQSSFDDTDIPF